MNLATLQDRGCFHFAYSVCKQCQAPRSQWQTSRRCRFMRTLRQRHPQMQLKRIGLLTFERFGNRTGKPYDHSTVIHHLQGNCTHA